MSAQQTQLSSPGIAVRRTASLPLAYAGRPSTPRILGSISGASGILDRPVKPGDDRLGAVALTFTSPRLRGEVGLRSNPGEGASRLNTDTDFFFGAPSPQPSPRARGEEVRSDEVTRPC
jgi:hypothetical protein